MKKITTSDLRLGNWLYDSQYKGFPMQVEGIGKDWIYLNFEENEGDVFENTDKEIYPIKITDRLIKSLGFKEIKECVSGKNVFRGYVLDILVEDDGLPRLYLFYFNNKLTLRISGDYSYFDRPNNIKYVHEIQNIYYVLTGKELEIKREWLRLMQRQQEQS